MPREAILARTFVELADSLVADFDVVDLLTLLSDRCVEVFDSGAAEIVLLAPEGDLRLMAYSSDAVRVLELFELQQRDGPCIDCYRTGEPVVNQDLRVVNGRWPEFVPRALDAGFVSVHALPLRLRGTVIGSLLLLRDAPGDLPPEDIATAQALADVATIAILNHRAVLEARVLSEQLQHALSSRVLIEQAKGMLAERTGTEVEEAFTILRAYARRHNLRLVRVAGDLLAGALDVRELRPSGTYESIDIQRASTYGARMDVVLLGTGSPLPDPDRAGPATLVRAGGRAFLVDCGRGVLQRAAAVGLGAGQVDALLLTHLHSDHLTDLNDVITTRWVTSFEPSPLVVIGPPGTRAVVDATLAALAHDVSYRLAHHEDLTWEPPVEVTECTGGTVLDAGGVRITVAPTDHRPVHPTNAYRIDHDGRAVVLAGDTVPCEGLDHLCEGADVLVHTVIRADLIEQLPIPRLVDICDYHSSVEDAARTAARAGVGTLVLTHYVPALVPGEEKVWRDRAAVHFAGAIELGDDLLTVAV